MNPTGKKSIITHKRLFFLEQLREKIQLDSFFCFITVDADIEHNETVIRFYQKNGFIPNEETGKKRQKTISMRRDILFKARP